MAGSPQRCVPSISRSGVNVTLCRGLGSAGVAYGVQLHGHHSQLVFLFAIPVSVYDIFHSILLSSS